jgi:predicted GH43/DUF377 family glycosyl hydrolase
MEYIMDQFVKFALERGAIIKPLIIDSKLTNGTGLFNPSVYVDGDRLLINIRHCQYTFYHSELGKHEHPWGPLLYMNPENDITLTTTNFLGELNDDLTIKYIHKVDTSKLDVKPIWEFIGLEDARVIRWGGKLYLTGVRRDTTTNGQGRMELSEIELTDTYAKEISRWRIPAPGADDTYCEKNWMPIIGLPFHYWKWSNPAEIVVVNPEKKTCETVFKSTDLYFATTPRGGGHVISLDDDWLTLTHEVDLWFNEAGKKDSIYTHRFVTWDKNKITPKQHSEEFSFMGAKVEFAAGMAEYKGDILITFGFQDNAAFILKCSKETIKDYIHG